MQSSDTSRALSQVKLLIEELNRLVELLQNAPPANLSTREKDEAIEESTNLCLTLSTLENSGIFEIDAAAILIPQLRPLFIELRRYERCRKSVADVMTILQESHTTRNSQSPTLPTAISKNDISTATTLPEKREKHLIPTVEAKETPKSHRFRKIISAIKRLRRHQQPVIKGESTISETTEPSNVEKVDKQGVIDGRPDSSQKELTYTVWKIRNVSSFLNGILADWVSTELRRPELKWEAWKVEVFKLAGWRSDIVVQTEPQKDSTQTEITVQGNKEESVTRVSKGEDNSHVIVLSKPKETSAAVSSYRSEIAPAKCGRCLGFFSVEPRCVCH